MMRTRRRLTRQPNKQKAVLRHDLIDRSAQPKDAYLLELAKTKHGHIWQLPRKVKRLLARQDSHHTLPIHVEDQCFFDAVATMVAWGESAKALNHWKSKIFAHTEDENERIRYFKAFKSYAGCQANGMPRGCSIWCATLSCTRRVFTIGAVSCGTIPVTACLSRKENSISVSRVSSKVSVWSSLCSAM